jgi:hypothetical protein
MSKAAVIGWQMMIPSLFLFETECDAGFFARGGMGMLVCKANAR